MSVFAFKPIEIQESNSVWQEGQCVMLHSNACGAWCEPVEQEILSPQQYLEAVDSAWISIMTN